MLEFGLVLWHMGRVFVDEEVYHFFIYFSDWWSSIMHPSLNKRELPCPYITIIL